MALGLNATEAPAWAQRFAEVLQRTFDNLTSVKTRTVSTDAELPDPVRWENRQVFVRSIGGTPVVCISDGTNWIRLDTGATV
jgi:hypothetical protein